MSNGHSPPCACQHIRPDGSCRCTQPALLPRDAISYKGECAIVLCDIETDGYDNLMEISAYDLVSQQWWKEGGPGIPTFPAKYKARK